MKKLYWNKEPVKLINMRKRKIQESIPSSGAELILNAKILKVTLRIREQYPELIKYLEEVTDTIPYNKDPEITLKNLNAYYETIQTMLNEYILEQEVIANDNKCIHS